ncbi:MAG: Gfo/Idh/MocA family oxidoreductase [Planctomycetota bacterium]|nr:Gfo/Idh/MocA family oxidoreductase [Planctomycetota bacterium]
MARRKRGKSGKVRVAIVGMGIGKANAKALQKNPRAEVAALCDLLPERMEAFAKELNLPGILRFTDYKEMCRDERIDAVFVGTPNQFHVPVALEAVRNGKHVLVTKPLADALAPARKLVKAAEAAKVVNMMSLSTRFGPGCRILGGYLARGEFGEVYYARARSVRRLGIPHWGLGFVRKGGGAWRDMGVHVLDAVWWLMGMPRPVSVLGVAGAKFGPRGEGYLGGRRPPKDYWSEYAADDYAGGFVRFENGAGVQVESFWASHQPEELQIELFGTQAGAKLSPLTIYRTHDYVTSNEAVEVPKETNGFDANTAHWVDCILDGVKCEAPLRHGLLVQEMMEALLDSAERGKEVRL